MIENVCAGKHTKYQPDDDHWKCPLCGSDNLNFFVDESDYIDCDLLHCNDSVICLTCDKAWSGINISYKMFKKSNKIVCFHCQGKGYIEGEPLATT